jgi:hypothetical protein
MKNRDVVDNVRGLRGFTIPPLYMSFIDYNSHSPSKGSKPRKPRTPPTDTEPKARFARLTSQIIFIISTE